MEEVLQRREVVRGSPVLKGILDRARRNAFIDANSGKSLMYTPPRKPSFLPGLNHIESEAWQRSASAESRWISVVWVEQQG